MKQSPQNFFQKHPGFDLYSMFWLLLFLLLGMAGRFYPPVWILAAVSLVYLLFRLLSRNRERRAMENARFVALLVSIGRWFKKKKRTIQPDKTHVYFRCPTCGQPMRVPRGLGRLEITCRNCSSRFETKS